MKDENRAVFAGVPEAASRAKQLRLGAAKDTGHARSVTGMLRLSWGMVPMTALGDAIRSLDPCTLANAGLGSVRRQSSLTEEQSSNRCANRELGHGREKARNSTWLWRYRQVAQQGCVPCICAVAHMLAQTARGHHHCHSGARAARTRHPFQHLLCRPMDSGLDAAHRPGMTEERLTASPTSPACAPAGPSGRYCHRPCAACRWRSTR